MGTTVGKIGIYITVEGSIVICYLLSQGGLERQWIFLTITTRKQHHPKEGEESSTTQKRGKWEPPLHLTSLDFTLLQFDLMTSCSLYFISFHFTHEKGDGSNTNKDRGTQKAKGPLYLTLTFTFVLTSISLHSLTHRSHRWILHHSFSNTVASVASTWLSQASVSLLVARLGGDSVTRCAVRYP